MSAPEFPSRLQPPGTLADVLASSGITDLLARLGRELIGLAPVKARIRDIAALLLVEKLRAARGFSAGAPGWKSTAA